MKNRINKVITIVLLIATIINTNSFIVFANIPQPDLSVDAKSAILIEPITGKVLFEQNPDERLPLASVTKIMTILLIYDALEQGKISWDNPVTVSEHAAGMGGSQIFLEPMEQQSVRELTKSIIIASANDAAVAMSEFIAGSEESFVSMMNQKAVDLGMNNTHFKNACGLDIDGHFSSARDVAIMSRELVNKYPQVHDYSTVWQDSIIHRTRRGDEEFGLTNTNKLIKWYNGSTGLKTGSTNAAKYCLSGTAERDGLKLVSVILGSPNPNVRFQEVMKMLDYGFSNFQLASGEAKGTIVGTINVSKGKLKQADIEVKEEIGTIIPKGNAETLEKEIIIDDSVKAPAVKGVKVGTIVYKYSGTEIGKTDLVLSNDIALASALDIMENLKDLWFSSAS